MADRLNISFDSDMLEEISAQFDLRAPNKEALRKLVFTLDGDYDPTVMQVLNLATGVGKTYLMAAFVEYLRRQGVGTKFLAGIAALYRWFWGTSAGGYAPGLFGVGGSPEWPGAAGFWPRGAFAGVHFQYPAIDCTEVRRRGYSWRHPGRDATQTASF